MTEKNRLILMGWYSQDLARSWLLPEIEQNCSQNGIIFPEAYGIFQKNKFAENSLYFHHFYAESNIPAGQEYGKIALMDNYKILPGSVMDCHSKVICFFTAYRIQPSCSAMRGHHELSLVQFRQGIPQVIYDELAEVKKQSFNPGSRYLCLYMPCI
ncbi:MAG: hypothetical protein K2K35_08905 [Lachnospiraceae bacterium]|nr:hypothetical protein [Lachnospiraceae bacterium]